MKDVFFFLYVIVAFASEIMSYIKWPLFFLTIFVCSFMISWGFRRLRELAEEERTDRL